MDKNDIEKIRNVIINYSEFHEYVPFFQNLLDHEYFGPIFKSLNKTEIDIVNKIINELIKEKISKLKTKGGQLFRRFYENNTEIFRDFRIMNEHSTISNSKEFQILGKKIEEEMFKLEGILTQTMLKKSQGLSKTVDAFYKIIYMFFPLYGEIE